MEDAAHDDIQRCFWTSQKIVQRRHLDGQIVAAVDAVLMPLQECQSFRRRYPGLEGELIQLKEDAGVRFVQREGALVVMQSTLAIATLVPERQTKVAMGCRVAIIQFQRPFPVVSIASS